jgi:hypothetical protein
MPPRVLVIVDRPRPNWIGPLERNGAELTILEIFRSEFNKHVFRLNGFVPRIVGEVLSTCYVERQMPFLIRVSSPAAIEFTTERNVEIAFDGRIMEFSRLDSKDATWLSAVQRNPLEVGVQYDIVREKDGSYSFANSPNNTSRSTL